MLAPWEELYKLTEQWKKDLSFYQEELNFLETLLFLYNSKPPANTEQLKQLIKDTSIQLKSLIIQADLHLAHLGKIIKEVDNSEDLLFREEHDILEDNINAFVQSFRELKQKLFIAAEQGIQAP